MLTVYGIVQSDLHNLPEALASFEDALDVCEQLGDPIGSWSVWNNISGICASAALPQISVSSAEVAITYASKIEDRQLSRKYEAFALTNIAYATLYSNSHALGLRSARRANALLEAIPLSHSPNAAPEVATRANAHCCQARHLLRVGSISDAEKCIQLSRKVLDQDLGQLPRARLVVETTSALFLAYAGRIDEAVADLEKALTRVRGLSPELVALVLRGLVEANNVAGRHVSGALYLEELARHMRVMHADSTLFHYRRHLGRVANAERHSPRVDWAARPRTPRRINEYLGSRDHFLEDLCAAAEMHDDASGLHPHRVGVLARYLAEASGFSREDASIISQAARLHDVGKVGVPTEILRKSGPLDAVEKKIMQTHAVAGADLLYSTDIACRDTAVAVARHHHEWWSGGGYPDEISGEAIPIAARIASLSEAFDAMVHDRPYRPRLTIARAIDLIAGRAGRQFDPTLAHRFCKIVRSLNDANADFDAFLEKDVRVGASAGLAKRFQRRSTD